MNESKHTPGPWKWEPRHCGWSALVGSRDKTVLLVFKPAKANAALIAAAPLMYEALEAIKVLFAKAQEDNAGEYLQAAVKVAKALAAVRGENS